VNALSYLRRSSADRRADALIGHSLGEFNALLAADVFDFETGLRLVQARGRLMSEAVGGGMAAVMKLDGDALRRTLAELGLEGIDLANFNAPGQIVISGKRDDIERAGKEFVERGIAFFPLNTSGAFHSRYMRDAITATSTWTSSRS
jgi:malonyl CoA-acyl carrier protein transacylase